MNREPVIDACLGRTQRRGLDIGLTDLVITFHAFIVDLDEHIVAYVLDIDVKCLVPFGVLAFLWLSL